MLWFSIALGSAEVLTTRIVLEAYRTDFWEWISGTKYLFLSI